MSASLYFEHVYTATAAQETKVTVSGESQGDVDGVTGVDETVVVSIPLAKFNALMTVGAQSASGVGYPSVTLDWNGLSTELDGKWAAFMGIANVPTTFEDDSTPAVLCPTLQKVFSSEGFTFAEESNTQDVLRLLSIPPEAISSVGVTGAISLASAMSTELMVGASTVLGGSVIAGTADTLADPQEKAVRGLFLQTLAAGRYGQSGSTAAADSNLPADGSTGFAFVEGDTISVYTKLTLMKTRRYIPDPADQLYGEGGMSFKINGTELVIDDIDDTLVAEDKLWTVKWVLTAAAP